MRKLTFLFPFYTFVLLFTLLSRGCQSMRYMQGVRNAAMHALQGGALLLWRMYVMGHPAFILPFEHDQYSVYFPRKQERETGEI